MTRRTDLTVTEPLHDLESRRDNAWNNYLRCKARYDATSERAGWIREDLAEQMCQWVRACELLDMAIDARMEHVRAVA